MKLYQNDETKSRQVESISHKIVDRRKNFQHAQNIKLLKISKVYHHTSTVLRHLKVMRLREIFNRFERVTIYEHYK